MGANDTSIVTSAYKPKSAAPTIPSFFTIQGGSVSRKHFKLIANALHSLAKQLTAPQHKEVCETFAGILATTNPRFNRSRFLDACGI
jgi:hypothetical protein